MNTAAAAILSGLRQLADTPEKKRELAACLRTLLSELDDSTGVSTVVPEASNVASDIASNVAPVVPEASNWIIYDLVGVEDDEVVEVVKDDDDDAACEHDLFANLPEKLGDGEYLMAFGIEQIKNPEEDYIDHYNNVGSLKIYVLNVKDGKRTIMVYEIEKSIGAFDGGLVSTVKFDFYYYKVESIPDKNTSRELYFDEEYREPTLKDTYVKYFKNNALKKLEKVEGFKQGNSFGKLTFLDGYYVDASTTSSGSYEESDESRFSWNLRDWK